MCSKMCQKLKKSYEPKEKNGKVLFRYNNFIVLYIVIFIVFILMGLFVLLLSFADRDLGVLAMIIIACGLLIIGFLRICEPAYVLDEDRLEIYVLGIHLKICYTDIKFVYKSEKSIVIEQREKYPYSIDTRYIDPSFEAYLNKYLRRYNQKVRKTVPSPEELKRLNIGIKTDFYSKQAGSILIYLIFAGWGVLCSRLLPFISFDELGLLWGVFALALVGSNIAMCFFMILRYSIKYHFTDTCIEQKVFFFTLKRVKLRDISKVTKKEEYVSSRKGGSYYTDTIRIYCKEKEFFKVRRINSAEFTNFTDVLIYFGNKNIKIQDVR